MRSVPEGPSIKVIADLLRRTLQGKIVRAFRSPLKKAAAEAWQPNIQGQRVDAVRSVGKHLLIELRKLVVRIACAACSSCRYYRARNSQRSQPFAGMCRTIQGKH